jgi:hypothetical protein
MNAENAWNTFSWMLFEPKIWSWVLVLQEFRKTLKGREQGASKCSGRADSYGSIRMRVVVQLQ